MEQAGDATRRWAEMLARWSPLIPYRSASVGRQGGLRAAAWGARVCLELETLRQKGVEHLDVPPDLKVARVVFGDVQ